MARPNPHRPAPTEGRQWNPDELTLTLDADLMLDWTLADIQTLEQVTGTRGVELVELIQAGGDAALYAAWLWVENRRKWPSLTLEACQEVPYGKVLELAAAGGATVEEVVAGDVPLPEAEGTTS